MAKLCSPLNLLLSLLLGRGRSSTFLAIRRAACDHCWWNRYEMRINGGCLGTLKFEHCELTLLKDKEGRGTSWDNVVSYTSSSRMVGS